MQHLSHQSKLFANFSVFPLGVLAFLITFIISSTITLPFINNRQNNQSVTHSSLTTQVLAANIVSPLPKEISPTPQIQSNNEKILPTPTSTVHIHLNSPTPTAIPTPTPTIKKTIQIQITPPATPQPTSAPQTIIVTTTQSPSSAPDDTVKQLLTLLNDARSAHGAENLSLSDKISDCALAHSKTMAARNGLFHDLVTDACDSSFHAMAENVGMATEQPSQAIVTIHNSMMNEGPGGGHYENIINTTYKAVGIGIYFDGTTTWITEDFAG